MKTLVLYSKLSLLAISFMLSSNIYAQCPPGMISYWKMNETGGNTLIDKAGGNNATCNQAPAVDPSGIIGSARLFLSDSASGITATVSNSDAFNFAAGSGFTIIYWIKFTAADLEGRSQVVISRGNYRGGTPQGTFWTGGIDPNGTLYFILQDSEGNRSDMGTSVGYDDGKWHQVAFVHNGSGQSNTIFVDGVEAAKKSAGYAADFSSSEPVQMGSLKSSSNAVNSYFYQGSLDEVAILDTALTQEDLSNQILLANSSVGICDGLNANILSIPVTRAIVGSPYLYTVYAGGLQNGMVYSLISSPEGMTIDSSSGVISWTPDDITTEAIVEVQAKNYIPPADTQKFRINLAEGTPCPEGLMVLLKLDESGGPVYSDFYGNHNANANVSPQATRGKIGGAQLFNASTQLDIPDLGDEFDWSKDGSFSFEYWLKTTTSADMICLARYMPNNHEAAFVSSGIDGSGKAVFELRDNNGVTDILNGTKMIADGNWHYIVNVRDGTKNENSIYVDGQEDIIESATYDSSFAAEDLTPINVGYLRRNSPDDPGYHFIGSLDEIAIYNRALTADEALDFYNNNNPSGHCGAGNFAPFIVSSPSTSATTNQDYSYFFIADDIDTTDVLTFSATTKPQWLTFNWFPGQKIATLAGIPQNAGEYPVTLRVSDGR